MGYTPQGHKDWTQLSEQVCIHTPSSINVSPEGQRLRTTLTHILSSYMTGKVTRTCQMFIKEYKLFLRCSVFYNNTY